MKSDRKNKLFIFIKTHNDGILLTILLLIFLTFSLFIALNLRPGILPDEPAHFAFSMHFSTTLGIPSDTYESYSWGWYIRQNPFLYYWLMGRFINIIALLNPTASNWQILVTLRVLNTIFALGTVIICFLLSKEVIKHKWWQLLPVFVLTNILMFVFLSAAVNYDNLANLFSIISIYFLVRVINHKRFVTNSILWMLFISLGTLVKYPILPLALSMTIVWLVFVIKNSINLSQRKLITHDIWLLIILVILMLGNFAIYGVNLLVYRTITPPCREILTDAQCEISPYIIRYQETAIQPKLTLSEARANGYPSPIGYALVDWVWFMLIRTVGVTGHQSYLPFHTITYFQYLFYWIIFMGFINLVYHRKVEFTKSSLVFIASFYSLVLIIMNYNAELTYGFQQISLQGRYIFPVIGALLILFTSVIKNIPLKLIRWPTLLFSLGLFFYGSTLTIILGYNSYFIDWFR